MKSKVEAIQNLPTPKTMRQAKGLIGLCNYLTMFSPELQNYMRVIYKTTRKMTNLNGVGTSTISREVKGNTTMPTCVIYA